MSLQDAFTADTGDTVRDHPMNGPLYVRSIVAMKDGGREVLLTSDCRGAIAEWHTGPEADHAVRYERVRFNCVGGIARRTHGWVDAATRRIVQTG